MKTIPLLFALFFASAHAEDVDEFQIPDQEIVPFAKAFRDALRRGDVPQVAEMISFPLKVNTEGGKSRKIGKPRFAGEFDRIFTESVIREVLGQDPATLFQNYQGVMFGNGAVWAAEFCGEKQRPDCPLRVIAVNRPAK